MKVFSVQMIRDDLIGILASIRKEKLKGDQSLIVNIEFNSRQDTQFLTPEVNHLLDSMRKWGADPSRYYMECGGRLAEDENGVYEAVLLYSDDKKYIEGFRMCYFRSHSISNEGTLQYSAPSIERILSIMGEIIQKPEVIRALNEVDYRIVDRLIHTSKEAVMKHFSQFPPELDKDKVDKGSKVPFSEYITDFFRSRGWNLYELTPESENRPDLFIPTGAVDQSEFGKSYAVLPQSAVPDSFEEVRSMMDHAVRTEQLPTMRLSMHETAVLDSITLNEDAARLTFIGKSGYMKVPYSNLRKSLEFLSSYDPQKT